MDDPVTKLDERFSDSGAQATPWATAREALQGAQLFWITTVRADGRPHVTPLVAVWVDETLHFCTGPEEQKALNLTTNGHVVVTTGCNRWDDGVDVMVEGDAQRVTDTQTLERLASAWAAKWDGRWRYGVTDGGFTHPEGGGFVVVFAVRATKVLAFTKGTFAHTRYLPRSTPAVPRTPSRGAGMSLSTSKLNPSIAVSDMAQAKDFYEGKLGLSSVQTGADGSAIYASGGDTSLHVYPSPTTAGQSNATLATWYVDDVDRIVDELTAKGVTFERFEGVTADEKGVSPRAGGGKVAWFKDPDGNTFAVESDD
jgi:catechol 2,3-dioxygenase-like lactoylglutathione lyase family enzyme/general stress protein 26